MKWNRYFGTGTVIFVYLFLISVDAHAQPDVYMDVYGNPPKGTLFVNIPKSKEYSEGRKIYIDVIKAQVKIDNINGISKKLFEGDDILIDVRLEFISHIDDKIFVFSLEVDVCQKMEFENNLKNMMYCNLIGSGEGRKGSFAMEPIFKNGFATNYRLHFGKIFKDDVSELPTVFDTVPATLRVEVQT